MLNRLVKGAGVACVPLVVALAILYQRIDARAQVDDARHSDAIIVLGAAVWPGGRSSPSLAARMQHAIALYRAGYASHLILSGGVGGNRPSEAEVMRRLATGSGVPEDALILDDTSHSTEENLAHAKALMDARGWRTALIVSAPYHLLRAETIARDLGMEVYGSPSSESTAFAAPVSRMGYTAREALALIWYYASKVVGEPSWLYALLKGKI